jgi:hypothetical protein
MSSELIKTTRDWGVVGGALLVVGPLAGGLADTLRTDSGLDGATPLTSSSPVLGVLIGLAVVAIAGAYGVMVGRIAHVRMGLICTGLVLMWPAWQFGRVSALIRDAGDLSPMSNFALEGAVFAIACTVASLLVLKLGRPVLPSAEPDSSKPLDWALACVATAVAGALGAWLIAQSPLQGQVFAAAVAAGVAGGAAGRSVAVRAPMLPILIGGFLLALVGPLVAQFTVSDPLTTLYAGDWPGLGLLTPFDWLAGVLVGAPLGEMWANSMVDRQPAPKASPRSV